MPFAMRNLTSVIALTILLPLLAPAQTRYRIVVLGSSTAYGVGASVPDSSWVGRVKAYYKSRHLLDTIINLAVPGSYTDSGIKLLPKALSYNPDIVLVSFPSNDIVADVSIPVYMSHLRKMYTTVRAAGKKCYVATTQPRDDPSAEPVLKIGRDSIVKEFPYHDLQFYDPLVAPGSYAFNPLYTAEGTHPNNAGHRLLFQSFLTAHVIPISAPLTLAQLSGRRTDRGVLLGWSVSVSAASLDFLIERSKDGISYESIHHEHFLSDSGKDQYSFIDENPPPARSFYRIRAVSDGNDTTYSPVLVLDAPAAGLAIENVYTTGGRYGITTTIDIPKDETFRLAIFNSAGAPVKKQSYASRAAVVTLEVPLPSLAAGIYFLQIVTPDGQRAIRSFAVL